MHGLEQRTQEVGRELFRRLRAIEEQSPARNRWAQHVLAWCLGDPEVKARVLRFVDVFPSLRSPRAIIQHLHDYFPTQGLRLPPMLRAGVAISRPGLMTGRPVAAAMRYVIEQMARQFIVGSTIEEALEGIARVESQGMGVTVDLLGEAVTSEAEADRYVERYQTLLRALVQAARTCEAPPLLTAAGPHVNLSVKPSALTSHFDPIALEEHCALALARLQPLLALAQQSGAFMTLDMEQYARRDLTLELAKRILDDAALGGFDQLGIVLQCYLTDTQEVARAWLDGMGEDHHHVTIRLVKGAYWDAEVVQARQEAWPEPVFLDKAASDEQFEQMTALLLSRHAQVRTAIASHNVRNIAHALALAETLHVPKDRLEFQLLYGMGDAIKTALVQLGYPVRVYAPCGALVPGMAYLVRRLLENTANESFLRQEQWHEVSDEQLLLPPTPAAPSIETQDPEAVRTEPLLNFAHEAARSQMREALAHVRARGAQRHPLQIGGRAVTTSAWIERPNPSQPQEIVGRVAQASAAETTQALEHASRAAASWGRTPVRERTQILRRAAELMRTERASLAALEVLEAGKTWREADADVCEAIDYLRYYAKQMDLLDQGQPVQVVPGEVNQYIYRPRGVAAVIAPWNFPAAILTGMTSAALVTGNPVIMKPSACSAHVAAHVADLLWRAGLPTGVLQCIAGPGSSVGRQLVEDPRVAMILFTGSRDVGLRILQSAAQLAPGQRVLKYVVAELGGKNAMIVDADADLDEAVPGIMASAFGYQGQKCSACSRLIVVKEAYEPLLQRVIDAMDSLRVLPSDDPRCDVGPVIDAAAQEKLLQAIARAAQEARIGYTMPQGRLPREGYFVPPTLVTDAAPHSFMAQEELFGPVLTLLRADSFAHAMTLANDVAYGLTGGVYSRRPAHLAQAKEELQVGNLYLNRKMTGAVVGRQPFGGWKLSGAGMKAGGPDYLLPLLRQQTITENTTRHGLPL